MNIYKELKQQLTREPKSWLVTGVAGFIGSNLLEALLRLGQRVTGLDNFSTGHHHNLEKVRNTLSPECWANFSFIEGDLQDSKACLRACEGVDYVLHQAALGSVPRSLKDPVAFNASNVTGFLNMFLAARDSGVGRFVYASSSSVYGDDECLPKIESRLGRPLSPYAATKRIDELYAEIFARCYDMQAVGLRYFNVFGPRQDPDGPYAAVIPKWIAAMIQDEPVQINGDGETSRDFCYVANVVQANLLAAITRNAEAVNQVFNIAVGERTTLNQLFKALRDGLLSQYSHLEEFNPIYCEFRSGDVRHSQADISKACRLLGYRPSHGLAKGLQECLDSYVADVPALKCEVVAQP